MGYCTEIKFPLWNMFNGHLLRTMFLKMHAVETDIMNEKRETELLMKANRFTMQMMAVAPAFIVATCTLWILHEAFMSLKSGLSGVFVSLRYGSMPHYVMQQLRD